MPKRSTRSKKSAKKKTEHAKQPKRKKARRNPSATSQTGQSRSTAESPAETPEELERRVIAFKVKMSAHDLTNPELKDGAARAEKLLRMKSTKTVSISLLSSLVISGELGLFMSMQPIQTLTFGAKEESFEDWVCQQVLEVKSFGHTSTLGVAVFAEKLESIKALLSIAPSPSDWVEIHQRPNVQSLQSALDTITKPAVASQVLELLPGFGLHAPKPSKEPEGLLEFLGMILHAIDPEKSAGGSRGASKMDKRAMKGILGGFKVMTPTERKKDLEDDMEDLQGFAPAWIKRLLSQQGDHLAILKELAPLPVGTDGGTLMDCLATMKFRLTPEVHIPDDLKWKAQRGVTRTDQEERVVDALMVAQLDGSARLLNYLLGATTPNNPTPRGLWKIEQQAANVKTLKRVSCLPDKLTTGKLGRKVAAVLSL